MDGHEKNKASISELQRRTFTIRKERCLAPRGKCRQPAVVFATVTGIAHVHTHAKCAAIDLRGAQAHQLSEGFLQTATRVVEVGLYASSAFYYQLPPEPGLLFGYGGIGTAEIRTG